MDDHESTKSAAASPPSGDSPSGEPPGLRDQLGATFAAGKRLLTAHIDLAKAEMADIAGAVGRMVGLFAGAFVLVLFAVTLLAIGGLLFLGEWLFGSIGWGVLLGTVLLIDLALMAMLLALDVKGGRIGVSFLLAVVVGVFVGVIMALDLTHRGWTSLGDQVAAQFDPNTRAVLLAAGASALVLGLLGFATGVRHGLGHALGRLLVWAVIGVLVGLLTVISIPPTVGAALGVLVALVVWPILAGLDLARSGVDGETLKKKFTPEATISLTKETIEWVRARTPLVPKS
ncbi:MAG TPA: phage holin family protein [Candidatus Limnocylindria bacterium]|nr:phage holin family protein [Candidatus Limnocylindria bacterium]